MIEFLMQQAINAVILGSLYSLMALGYTMVYGIIKLINFSNGEIYMIGSFIGYFLISLLKSWKIFPNEVIFFLAILLSMIFCSILGIAIEFLAYRPLRKASRISVLITAIGVSYFLQNIMIYFFSPDTRPFPQIIETKIFHFGFLNITTIQLMILIISISLIFILQFIIYKTKIGQAMRAVSIDMDTAKLMGINVNKIISFTFALGAALASAFGILISLYYNSLDPMMGVFPGIKCFIAAVLGGIGIIPGASLGGFIVGTIETLTISFGFSSYKDAITYGALIIILLVRPNGILGKSTKEKV